MNAKNFMSYMKVRPVRVRIFVPFEFWGLIPTLVAALLATVVYFFSPAWGVMLYIIIGACFLLANSIRNVETSQVMICLHFNIPSQRVRQRGVHFVFPFITLCDFFTINFVREEKRMGNLETKGDGYRLGYEYVLKTKINKNLVYLYEEDVLRGKEPEVIAALNDALMEASKNEVKRYSHEDLVEENTDLQETLKAKIEESFLNLFEDSLDLLCHHRDLYEVDLTITNLIFDEAYMAKLKQKNQAKMDAEIAKLDKQATITDAEAKAQALKIEGKAKAEAIKMEADALKQNPDIIRYETAKHSNLQNVLGEGANILLGAGTGKS